MLLRKENLLESRKNLLKIDENFSYGCSLELMFSQKDWLQIPFSKKRKCFIIEKDRGSLKIYFRKELSPEN